MDQVGDGILDSFRLGIDPQRVIGDALVPAADFGIALGLSLGLKVLELREVGSLPDQAASDGPEGGFLSGRDTGKRGDAGFLLCAYCGAEPDRAEGHA